MLLEEADRIRIFAETDISTEAFRSMLRDFCHTYQIPFLENNIPKTCRNAAKIMYRMSEDNHKPKSRFDELSKYLRSIPRDDIDDHFNPLKVKEKWLKFFRSGVQKIVVDTDRALKNDVNDSLRVFI